MPSLALVRAANAAFSPSYLPVAIFVGATAGIGKAAAQAFARYTKGNAHIIIVGRNEATAGAVLSSFPAPSVPGAAHEFVACDMSLMANVHTTTSALLTRLPKVNLLVITAGFMSLKGREETTEGLDRRLAVHYYARWKWMYDLLPLLRRARDAGEDAKAMSVLGAGNGVSFDIDNLGLRKNYIASHPGNAGPTYTDLAMQSFAEQNPGIAFIHTNPGAVRTDLLEKAHWTMRIASPLLMGLLYPITTSPEECGEYTLYALFQSRDGVARRGSRGEDLGKSPLCEDKDKRQRLWEHTKDEVGHAIKETSPS